MTKFQNEEEKFWREIQILRKLAARVSFESDVRWKLEKSSAVSERNFCRMDNRNAAAKYGEEIT